jgi:hypothetical protein
MGHTQRGHEYEWAAQYYVDGSDAEEFIDQDWADSLESLLDKVEANFQDDVRPNMAVKLCLVEHRYDEDGNPDPRFAALGGPCWPTYEEDGEPISAEFAGVLTVFYDRIAAICQTSN